MTTARSAERPPRFKVVGWVCRNELQRLRGLRANVAVALVLGFSLLAGLDAAARYHEAQQATAAVAQDYEEALHGVSIDRAAEILHPALKSPWRLTLVVEGGQQDAPDLVRQAPSPLINPEIRRARAAVDLFPIREPLDWMFVIRLVLPLAAALLGYDVVSGDRRSGTLKLALSYAVPRWQVLAGKFAAIWLTLATPLALGGLVGFGVTAATGSVPFTCEDLGKASWVLWLGGWAAAYFTLVALVVSSLVRDAATSLSMLAWLWVSAALGVPALSNLLAHLSGPLPSERETEQELAQLDHLVSVEFPGEGTWRQSQWAAADGFALERISALAEIRRAALHEKQRNTLLKRKLTQARFARRIALASPFALLQEIAERLVGAGLDRDQRFLDQTLSFRKVLAAHLHQLDVRDPKSPHLEFFSGYLSRRPLDPARVPRFQFREATLAEGAKAAAPSLALLAVQTVALGAAAVLAFRRLAVE